MVTRRQSHDSQAIFHFPFDIFHLPFTKDFSLDGGMARSAREDNSSPGTGRVSNGEMKKCQMRNEK